MSLSASSALPRTRSRIIQRAARFYYLPQQMCFVGRMDGNPSFGYAAVRGPKLNLLRIEEQLSAAHLRLARVYVECPPYHEVIKRYDKATTVFMWTRHIGIARTTMAKGSSAARTSPCWLNCWARLRGSSFFP